MAAKTNEKFLKKCVLNSDVFAMCTQHALTTEKQEIMGLLIGEVNEEEQTSYISACVILHRSDKQPDRVEISPEQLCTASSDAEKLAKKLNRPMRVLGWYHSHPHITVWPSHVDIRTQGMYQTMDPFFVGLIFSVFQSDSRLNTNQLQVTCFQCQSYEGISGPERREVELVIKSSPMQDYNLEGIANLPRILFQEEVDCYEAQQIQEQDELASLHNDSVQTLALVHIVSKVARPLCEDLEERLVTAKVRVKQLKEIRAQLLKEAEELSFDYDEDEDTNDEDSEKDESDEKTENEQKEKIEEKPEHSRKSENERPENIENKDKKLNTRDIKAKKSANK